MLRASTCHAPGVGRCADSVSCMRAKQNAVVRRVVRAIRGRYGTPGAPPQQPERNSMVGGMAAKAANREACCPGAAGGASGATCAPESALPLRRSWCPAGEVCTHAGVAGQAACQLDRAENFLPKVQVPPVGSSLPCTPACRTCAHCLAHMLSGFVPQALLVAVYPIPCLTPVAQSLLESSAALLALLLPLLFPACSRPSCAATCVKRVCH